MSDAGNGGGSICVGVVGNGKFLSLPLNFLLILNCSKKCLNKTHLSGSVS